MMYCPECRPLVFGRSANGTGRIPSRFWSSSHVFALLHQASSPIDGRCAMCGLRFARRTDTARFALLVMIFVLAGAIVLLAFFSRRSIQ